MHNKWQIKIEGNQAEELFCQTAQSRGWNVRSCSARQNMNDHIDFFIQNTKKTYGIDVKAQKRQQRNMNQQTEWIPIEFVGVVHPATKIVHFSHKVFDPENPCFSLGSGRPGWIYGKADFIAFHMGDTFWMTPRLKLLELCLTTINFCVRAKNSVSAKYVVYSRMGRGDLISYVHKEDVEPFVVKWPTSSLCINNN